MKLKVYLIDGKIYDVTFEQFNEIKDCRSWINKSLQFITIGDNIVVNINHIVRMEKDET